MATQQEISKIQEQAQELVNNLEELHRQVGSYQGAKDELQKATSQIGVFAERTKQLTEESHNIIKRINEIGSASIVDEIKENHNIIKTITENGNASIIEKLSEIMRVYKKNTQTLLIVLLSGFGLMTLLQILFFFLTRR